MSDTYAQVMRSAEHSGAPAFDDAVAAFRSALDQVSDDVTIEDVPPPKRLAPHATAIAATAHRDGDEVATGRLVLLFDPDGNDGWCGMFRLVAYVHADIEPEVAADPLLGEVGWTWLGASAQGTGINAEAKFLLFSYAFETLGVARVDLKTDARNDRSRRAIGGLGARFEGVLRCWSPSRAPGEEGMLRDSAMFSVVAAEWPAVKSTLAIRVASASADRHKP